VLVIIDRSLKTRVDVFVDLDGDGPRIVNSVSSSSKSVKYMIKFLLDHCTSAGCRGSDLRFDCPEWVVDILTTRFLSSIVTAYCEGRVTVDDISTSASW